MIIDLHCHTKYSGDNHLEPEDLILRAMEVGLDAVCLTEHHSMHCSHSISRLTIPAGFLVLRGVEVSTDNGHLLVYGVHGDEWKPMGEKLLSQARQSGGERPRAGRRVCSRASFQRVGIHRGQSVFIRWL